MNEFDIKIKQLEQELATVKAEKKRVEELEASLSIEQRLAITLHDICCHDNHDDGCPWYNEISGGVHIWGDLAHSWGDLAHSHWLGRAELAKRAIARYGIDLRDLWRILQSLKAAGVL